MRDQLDLLHLAPTLRVGTHGRTGISEEREACTVLLRGNGRRRGAETRRQIFQSDLNRPIKFVAALRTDIDRHGTALADGGCRWTETDREIRPRRTHRQLISVPGAALPARIADAHLILAVGGWVKDQTRILAESAVAVVIAIIESDNGKTIGWELGAGRVDRYFVHRLAERMMGRCSAEVAAPPPAGAPELAIIIGVFRQLPDADQLVAEEHVVVHRQFAPRLDADAGRSRIVIAENRVDLGQRAKRGPRQRLPLSVEDLDDGIQRRAEASGVDFQQQPLAFLGLESPGLRRAGQLDASVGRARNRYHGERGA